MLAAMGITAFAAGDPDPTRTLANTNAPPRHAVIWRSPEVLVCMMHDFMMRAPYKVRRASIWPEATYALELRL